MKSGDRLDALDQTRTGLQINPTHRRKRWLRKRMRCVFRADRREGDARSSGRARDRKLRRSAVMASCGPDTSERRGPSSCRRVFARAGFICELGQKVELQPTAIVQHRGFESHSTRLQLDGEGESLTEFQTGYADRRASQGLAGRLAPSTILLTGWQRTAAKAAFPA